MKLKAVCIALLGLLVFTQCKKKKDENTDFDKGPIMANMADNYIIPGYADLKTKIDVLETTWNDFLADKTQAKLDISKQAWADANISFQHVKAFDFGPAMSANLVFSFGTFPCDTAQINSNIQNGGYDLNTNNLDASGFDALDYLFYNAGVLNKFQNSINTCTYVSDIISKMKTEIVAVVSGWSSYRATFVNGTSNESTSPFALLVNNFCKDFELCKTTKLGFPIGNHTLGIQQPNYLEARRSGLGKTLLAENIRGSRAIFYGLNLSGNNNGAGFDDYLNAIADKASLSTTIATRFDYMLSTPQTWSGTLEDLMTSSPSTLENFYDYQQGSVINMKTDMASAFGVLITYQDTDGD
jgi:predicted lipoprotein